MGEIGFLSRSAMAEPRDGANSFSQDLTIVRMVRATLGLSGTHPTQSSQNLYGQHMISMTDAQITLKKELVSPFISKYLEVMTPQFIYLRPATIWQYFESFFSGRKSIGLDVSDSDQNHVEAFNIYMAVSVGILLSEESGHIHGLATSLHASATNLFSKILYAGNRNDVLSCMLSFIIYSMHSAQGGSTWHLVGLAMTKAIAFGFHKEAESDHRMSNNDLINRRNIFWSLYSVDR